MNKKGNVFAGVLILLMLATILGANLPTSSIESILHGVGVEITEKDGSYSINTIFSESAKATNYTVLADYNKVDSLSLEPYRAKEITSTVSYSPVGSAVTSGASSGSLFVVVGSNNPGIVYSQRYYIKNGEIIPQSYFNYILQEVFHLPPFLI